MGHLLLSGIPDGLDLAVESCFVFYEFLSAWRAIVLLVWRWRFPKIASPVLRSARMRNINDRDVSLLRKKKMMIASWLLIPRYLFVFVLTTILQVHEKFGGRRKWQIQFDASLLGRGAQLGRTRSRRCPLFHEDAWWTTQGGALRLAW